MKRFYSKVLAVTLLLASMVLSNFNIQAADVEIISAEEQDTEVTEELQDDVTENASEETDVDVHEEAGIEDCTEIYEEVYVSDISDMVYSAGGWGIPTDALDSVEVEATEKVEFYSISNEERLKNAILTALLNETEYIDVSSYNISYEYAEDIEALFEQVLNDNPRLFYVFNSIDMTGTRDQIQGLWFYYNEVTIEEKELFNSKIDEIVALIDNNMTDLEKALFIHDYLILNCTYAKAEYDAGTLYTVPHVYDAYGCIVNGYAVCMGYAEAYRLLLREVGIECEYCGSADMDHAWNIIKIDNEWYHVDVTWDDNCNGIDSKIVQHKYFLLSDNEMQNRGHYNWTNTIKCTSTKYDAEDYWWNFVESEILIKNHLYYYVMIHDDRSFDVMERNGNTATVKHSAPAWSAYYEWNRSSVWLLLPEISIQGDYIFFNDSTNVYAINLKDSTVKTVYTHTRTEECISGCKVYGDGKAYLNIQFDPKSDRNKTERITVNITDKIPDFKIKGDVTGDGKVNSQDLNAVRNHINYAAQITDEYKFRCADVTGDGRINSQDLNAIRNHINYVDRFW
ncbi:MAG: dockerin type I domain-containing protein [Clostridium sp.]|nr:dockerin type I domain-containing protein [Clostridium sp.]